MITKPSENKILTYVKYQSFCDINEIFVDYKIDIFYFIKSFLVYYYEYPTLLKMIFLIY
jgi:hypothetical protein